MMAAHATPKWLAAAMQQNDYVVIDVSYRHSRPYIANSYRFAIPLAAYAPVVAFESLVLNVGVLRARNIVLYDNDGFSAQLSWLLFLVNGYSVGQLSVLIGGKGLWSYDFSDTADMIQRAKAPASVQHIRYELFASAQDVLFCIYQSYSTDQQLTNRISQVLLANGSQPTMDFNAMIDVRERFVYPLPGAVVIDRQAFSNGEAGVDKTLFSRLGINLEARCVFLGNSLDDIAPAYFAAYLACGSVENLFIMPCTDEKLQHVLGAQKIDIDGVKTSSL